MVKILHHYAPKILELKPLGPLPQLFPYYTNCMGQYYLDIRV